MEYRVIAGMKVPLPLVPEIAEALIAKRPEAAEGAADLEAAGRAALRALVIEVWADHKRRKVMDGLDVEVARKITEFEQQAEAVRQQTLIDAQQIEAEEVTDTPIAP